MGALLIPKSSPGALKGLIGGAGGINGTGFAAPNGTQYASPATQDQIAASYGGAQNSMQSQQALLQALQGQNGLANQSQVYNQFQGVANGTGPNPAQAMLNQATGQNVANQAALMAGQRGANANVGLLARQIGQQGAGIQQNAVGQAATMQANQSLNALNSAGNIAGVQAGNQIAQTNSNVNSQQAEQQALLNAQLQTNATNAGLQSNVNNVNGALAGQVMAGQQKLIGGLASGIGSAAAMAGGGQITAAPANGPRSMIGQALAGGYANGGMAMDYRSGGPVNAASAAQKAVSPGNNYANDKIPAVLSEKEIVLPRSVTLAPDPVAASAKFVAAVMAKRKGLAK